MLLAILFNNCGKKHHHVGRMVTKLTPNEKGEDIAITYTDSGQLRARLFSPLIEHFKNDNPYIEMKKGLKIYFYGGGEEGSPTSMLRAEYGIKYENQQQIIVKNDVVAVNVDHDTLNTEMLVWDELKKKIYSKKAVRIKKKDETIYGEGFESNEDFTNYTVFHITGIIKTKVPN